MTEWVGSPNQDLGLGEMGEEKLSPLEFSVPRILGLVVEASALKTS